MSKKEIIAKLVALGITFDENLSATELKVILKKAEEDKEIADKAANDLENKDKENKDNVKVEDKKDDIITDKEEVKDIKDMTYEELLVKCQNYQVMPIYDNIKEKFGLGYTTHDKIFNSVYEAAVYNLFIKLQNEG